MSRQHTSRGLELSGLTLVPPGASSPLFSELSLHLNRGEIVGVFGPSGCGKSSLLRVCLGLTPTGSRVSGSLRLDGMELLTYNEEQWRNLRGQKFGWMTQAVATALEPHARIAPQIIPVLCRLRAYTEDQARKALLEHLNAMGAAPELDILSRRWSELSGGQQRLVLTSVWLCALPELLFLDEPSVGMDAIYRNRLAASLRATRDATGLTVMIVSHDWNFTQAVADRCLIMREGLLEEVAKCGGDGSAPSTVESTVEACGDEILRVQGLAKSYRQADSEEVVFNGLSFSVRRGKVLVFWGRSGSGKTTAVRCALRLLEPDSGEIQFRGADLLKLNDSDLRATRRFMQLVEQDAHSTIDPKWLVHDILTEGARWHGVPNKLQEEQIIYWMRSLGLPKILLRRRGGELSIGEAQRVALARALLLQPELLALDEPTANLDRDSRSLLVDCIFDYQTNCGGGVLLISHDAELVQDLADEIVVFG